jgi:hypothetical protein
MVLKNWQNSKIMKNNLKFLSCLLLISSLLNAQNYGIEYDSTETKVAVKELATSKLTTDFIYDEIEIIDYLGIIRKDKKYGILDVNSGKTYCCEYDMIEEFDTLNYPGVKGVVRKNGKKGLIGLSKVKSNLEIILPFEYKNIELSSDLDYLYILRKGNKYGIFNLKNRKFMIPCIIDKFPSLEIYNNYIVVRKEKEKYGLYTLDGKVLLKPTYKAIYGLCTGVDVFEVKAGKKSCIYDATTKKFLVEPIKGSLELSEISDRFYSLYLRNSQNYVDTQTGKPILPLNYNFTGWLNKNRYMLVELKGKYGVYDFTELKLVVACKYEDEHVIYEKERQYFD